MILRGLHSRLALGTAVMTRGQRSGPTTTTYAPSMAGKRSPLSFPSKASPSWFVLDP
jgi:hypothetical protein